MNILKKVSISLAVAAVLTAPVFVSGKAQAATVVMKLGSTGTQVTELQNELKGLGYFTGANPTGYYGSITRYSVMRFQAANGLSADGIAGPATQAKIDSIISNQSSSFYTVKAGDSLWTISLKYGLTSERLKVINNLASNTIYEGQVLKVTSPADTQAVAQITESQNETLYWLARIIQAEASGEPYSGKVAVGNVIMNRVASPDFPNTVKAVVFDDYKGIPQFSPVADGTIYNTPSQDSIKAAQEALNGVKPVGSATYFFNPDKSAGTWIVNNKTYVTRIGDHVFYR